MPFLKVRFFSYRNLEDAEIPVDAERIFLIGENGQGKTNFLEALYYLSFGSSFRGSPDSEAPRDGQRNFLLSASTKDSLGSDLPAEELRVAWDHGFKEIRRSGKKLSDRKELLESNPAIVFCHEDFSFAAGEPERRRFFFDQTASLVSNTYIDTLRAYKRILKQRNAALKDGRLALLDILDEQMASVGIVLLDARHQLELDIARLFQELYAEVSLLGRDVNLVYKPSWPRGASLAVILENLSRRRSDEVTMGTSLSGPHRDRWAFSCAGKDFTSTGSTGQLRLLSLVLRSVQARYYTERAGKKPVLLLDDVLLELDPEKRKRFFASLPESSQAFFTFLPGEPWEDYRSDSMIVYHVEHGRFANQGCILPAPRLF